MKINDFTVHVLYVFDLWSMTPPSTNIETHVISNTTLIYHL